MHDRAPRFSDVEARACAAATAALAEGPAAAARAAIAAAEAFLAETIAIIGLEPQMAALQCGPGCLSCCHQMVGVTMAELALVQEAVAALPQPEQDATRARIADIARRGQGLSQTQWWAARLRCPLLDEAGSCLVHAARPLPCRAMNSSNAETCRRSYAGEALDIPVLAAQHRIHGHAQRGLHQALAAAGLPIQVVGMGTAL